MTVEEKRVNNMVIKEIDKLIEKQNKKADKSRQKKNNAQVTYKGEVYKTENEIMEAYACDMFSSAVCDRLVFKLIDKKDGAPNDLTSEETVLLLLTKMRDNLIYEIKQSDLQEKNKKKWNDRFTDLINKGLSYKEAELQVENERLMEQLD